MQHFCDSVHGKTLVIEKDSEGFFSGRSAPVCFLYRPLILTFFTFITLFSVDEPIFDEARMLTSWTPQKSKLLVEEVWIGAA